jgi:hypothetical protein
VRSAYVYYRIDSEQTALAAARIDALLGAMALHCDTPPRRLSRCDDTTTWMEVYEGIADFAAFATALDAAAQTFDCSTFTRGERHLECFRAPDPAT